jgi:hypothetical protein
MARCLNMNRRLFIQLCSFENGFLFHFKLKKKFFLVRHALEHSLDRILAHHLNMISPFASVV